MSKKIIKCQSPVIAEEKAEAFQGRRRIIPEIFVRLESRSIGKVDSKQVPARHSGREQRPSRSEQAEKSMPAVSAATALNQAVEKRVKQFEDRFQMEKEQAFNEGLSRGEAKGLSDGLKDVERIEKLFGQLVGEFSAQKDKYFQEAEAGVARLSLEIAETIIGEASTKVSADVLQHNLKRCLDVLKGAGRVKIRINPIDYDFARGHTRILELVTNDRYTMEFEPDSSIAPGGCYLEATAGAVDGRLESQFELMRDNFLQLT